MNKDLHIERRDAVLWLTISREERRNAITADVLDGLSRGLDQAERDRSIRAVVLTGAGDKAFCSGADLQDGRMFDLDPSQPYHRLGLLFRQARQATVPIVARVNGACVAGGMGLMSMCDMAVAATHAVFGLPEVKVGVFPAQVISLLQHQMPRKLLTRMCVTGEMLSAVQAHRIGLLNEVDDDPDKALETLLRMVLDRSPSAIRRGLYTMKRIEAMPFEEAVSFAESQIALLAMTEDAKEGQAAFREKRNPVWTGK